MRHSNSPQNLSHSNSPTLNRPGPAHIEGYGWAGKTRTRPRANSISRPSIASQTFQSSPIQQVLPAVACHCWTSKTTLDQRKPYIRKVCRSNAERKNIFYCPWLWGKAIEAEGGTPGALEASPLFLPPPPSFFFLLALLQGRSAPTWGRPRPGRPAQAAHRPGRRPGRATRRAAPQLEGEADTRRAEPSHTPSRSSRRPGADTRRPGPRPDELEPGAEIQIREPGAEGDELAGGEIGRSRRAGRQDRSLTRDPPSCYEIQTSRSRASAIGAEPVPRSIRPRQTYTHRGERRTWGNVGAEIQPTRASRRGPGRCALVKLTHTPTSSGPGRCALVKLTHTPTRTRGQGGAPC